jgi:hypothetical protein
MLKAHRFILAALAATVLGTAPACAAQYGLGRYPQGGVRVDDRAYRNGFQEGRQQGENDAQRGRTYDYDNHREFRNADQGYGGYGNRNEYRRVFRDGFIAGYDEGYRRYARGSSRYPSGPFPYPDRNRDGYPDRGYPGNYPANGTIYRSPAADNGYRDGLEEGRKAGRSGDRPDAIRESRYRDGEHGYDRRYGSRDDYKREYRAAFVQGYDEGYRNSSRW